MDARYMIVILGSYKGIEEDLNNIANGEDGVNYVDGNGIFMGTFYSVYNTIEIYENLVHIPAFLLFEISDPSHSAISLPTKYLKGLFPEIEKTLNELTGEPKVKTRRKGRKKLEVEEYNNVDDILDKLSRNNYDRGCLTESEIEILEKSS
jgi:hypothetical protein